MTSKTRSSGVQWTAGPEGAYKALLRSPVSWQVILTSSLSAPCGTESAKPAARPVSMLRLPPLLEKVAVTMTGCTASTVSAVVGNRLPVEPPLVPQDAHKGSATRHKNTGKEREVEWGRFIAAPRYYPCDSDAMVAAEAVVVEPFDALPSGS